MNTNPVHGPDPALLAKAETLTEALPYLQRYAGKTFVVKYGGHAMGDPELQRGFRRGRGAAEGVRHQSGGGAWRRPADRIDAEAPRRQIALRRRPARHRQGDGRDRRDGAGRLDQQRDRRLDRGGGGQAVGISGKDGGLVLAEKVRRTEPDRLQGIERHVDLGFVGEPVAVDRSILDTLSASGIIPVIAPVGIGADGHTYNINADTMAGAIAGAIGASRFFLLTDVPGVLDKDKNLVTDLTPADVAVLKADGTISSGMIPKLETCVARRRGGRGCRRGAGRARAATACCWRSSPGAARAR